MKDQLLDELVGNEIDEALARGIEKHRMHPTEAMYRSIGFLFGRYATAEGFQEAAAIAGEAALGLSTLENETHGKH